MIRAAFAITAVAALSGCTTMGVNVDILRPTYASTAATASRERATVAQLLGGNDPARRSYVANLTDKAMAIRALCYQDISNKLVDKDKHAAPAEKNAYDDALARLAKENAPNGIDRTRQILLKHYTEEFSGLDNKTRLSLQNLPEARRFVSDEKISITTGIRAQIDLHITAYDDLARSSLSEQRQCQFFVISNPVNGAAKVSTMLTAVSRQVESAPQKTKDVLEKTQQEASNAPATEPLAIPPTILGEGSALTGFLDAYYVASAPSKAWQTKFNLAHGTGVFGSSDIVIKLNSAADFTIKGFTFDARSTADMVSKAGVAALKLVAEAYGMPLPAGGAGATGNASATPPSPTAAAESNIATTEARSTAYHQSLRSVANLILADWDRLTTGNAAAQSALSTSFDANKNAWKAPVISTTPAK